MIERDKKMWAFQLGKNVKTKHRIYLKPGSMNKHQINYRKGPEMWDATPKKVQEQPMLG